MLLDRPLLGPNETSFVERLNSFLNSEIIFKSAAFATGTFDSLTGVVAQLLGLLVEVGELDLAAAAAGFATELTATDTDVTTTDAAFAVTEPGRLFTLEKMRWAVKELGVVALTFAEEGDPVVLALDGVLPVLLLSV
jgi:hypothetical protein